MRAGEPGPYSITGARAAEASASAGATCSLLEQAPCRWRQVRAPRTRSLELVPRTGRRQVQEPQTLSLELVSHERRQVLDERSQSLALVLYL